MARRNPHRDLVARLQHGVRQTQGRTLFAEADPGSIQPPPQVVRECTTGKTRWDTRREAEAGLEWIRDHPDPSRMYEPCAVIHCRKCNGWHLTSRQQKVWGKTKTPRGHR